MLKSIRRVHLSVAFATALAISVVYVAIDQDRSPTDAGLAQVGQNDGYENPVRVESDVAETNLIVEEDGPVVVTELEPSSQDCTWEPVYLPQPDGRTVTSKHCVNNAARAEDPYDAYDNETLKVMAYSDAVAAERLGMRLREVDERNALRFIIRAAALSGGDSSPILKYSNAYPKPSFVDGEPVLKTIHTKYVLSAVAERLGETHTGMEHWESQVRATSDTPDATLKGLKRSADNIIGAIEDIQLEVLGGVPTGEKHDS
ncbi:MAG: hypothetical protein QNJ14_15425 [Woeseiaceae bacterium]|nr:hypothetical protein [Woeseiaceae bacterium]